METEHGVDKVMCLELRSGRFNLLQKNLHTTEVKPGDVLDLVANNSNL
jgi:hypothetical protein